MDFTAAILKLTMILKIAFCDISTISKIALRGGILLQN